MKRKIRRYIQIHIPSDKVGLKREMRKLRLLPEFRAMSGPDLMVLAMEDFIAKHKRPKEF